MLKILRRLEILKINPVQSGVIQGTDEPYDWHTAECVLMTDAGDIDSVGRLVFPRALRETLGGMPNPGHYNAVLSLGASKGDIRAQIVDLEPVSGLHCDGK